MKKSNLFIVVIVAILITGAWGTAFVNDQARASEYAALIEKAKQSEEVKAFKPAMANYAKAIKINPDNPDLYLKYADAAYAIGRYKLFEDSMKRAIAVIDDNAPFYDRLIRYHYANARYADVVSNIIAAKKNNIDVTPYVEMYRVSKYRFRNLGGTYSSVQTFSGKYAAVQVKELWGFVDDNGSFAVQPIFQAAGAFSGGMAPVMLNGEWFYIDSVGDRIVASKEPYEKLFSFYEGVAAVKLGGKFGYANSVLKHGKVEWDYATNYNKGIAAVQRDSKWALRSKDGNLLTDFIFDDIRYDERNLCFINGVVFGKQNKAYGMYDNIGRKISDVSFEDVRPFYGTEPAAVMKDGSWGFTDKTGIMTSSKGYEDAGSYNSGLAPVKVNGLWGYVDLQGALVIAPQFEDARTFGPNKIAAVKSEGVWRFIQLLF